MREKIKSYMDSNLKCFELEGVEITEEDIDFVEEKVRRGKRVEDACNEVLNGIRECLDEGLGAFEDTD